MPLIAQPYACKSPCFSIITVRLLRPDAFLLWSNRQLYLAPTVGNGKDLPLPIIRLRLGVQAPGQASPHRLSSEDDRCRLALGRTFVGVLHRHGHGVSGLL